MNRNRGAAYPSRYSLYRPTNPFSSIPFAPGAPMDGLLAGESFRLKITRDAADPGDTMAADAELVSVEIREA